MNVRVNSQEPPAQSIRYRGADGDTWERTGDNVSLIKAANPADDFFIGHRCFTNIPFAEADREHHLTPITGGAR